MPVYSHWCLWEDQSAGHGGLEMERRAVGAAIEQTKQEPVVSMACFCYV